MREVLIGRFAAIPRQITRLSLPPTLVRPFLFLAVRHLLARFSSQEHHLLYVTASPLLTPLIHLLLSSDADLAKVSPHVLIPERFALHMGTHLVSRYAHIHKAFVTIEQLRWSRIPVSAGEDTQPAKEGEQGHTHAFYRDGDDKRVVHAEVRFHSGIRII